MYQMHTAQKGKKMDEEENKKEKIAIANIKGLLYQAKYNIETKLNIEGVNKKDAITYIDMTWKELNDYLEKYLF